MRYTEMFGSKQHDIDYITMALRSQLQWDRDLYYLVVGADSIKAVDHTGRLDGTTANWLYTLKGTKIFNLIKMVAKEIEKGTEQYQAALKVLRREYNKAHKEVN